MSVSALSASLTWPDVLHWHRRLNRCGVTEVPGQPGMSAVAHVQGLYPDHAKVYLLVRTRRGTCLSLVVALADSPPITGPADLPGREAALAELDVGQMVAALAAVEPAFVGGRLDAIRDFARRWRRERLSVRHPAMGELVAYPLHFPTLLRNFGLDPTQPLLAVRRDWMTVADLAGHAGLPMAPAVFDAFMAEETARAQAVLRPARALVDREAAGLLGLAARYDQEVLRYYAHSGPHRLRRYQAAVSYPIFARAIAEIPALRRTVDQGRPLAPALAATYLVSEATLRCFQSFRHLTFTDHIDYLLLFLDDLDGGLCPGRRWRPDQPLERDSWACFAALASEINSLAFHAGGRVGRRAALADLLRGFDGDWCRLFADLGGHRVADGVPLERVPVLNSPDAPLRPRRRAVDEERIAGAVAWEGFHRELVLPWRGEHIRDAVRAFAYVVALPFAAHAAGAAEVAVDKPALKMAEEVARAFLLRGRTLAQVIAFSNRFHRSIARLFPAGDLRNLRGADLAWSRPSPDMVAPNGLALVPLGSVQDLVQEGEAQGNCLPFYTVRCAIENHRVVSVRRGATRIAAFEIARETWPPVWRLYQIEGPGNAPAPDEAAVAAEWYLDWLNRQDGDIAVAADRTVADTDVLRSLCGFDWRDPAALDTMWALWARRPARDPAARPVLPRGVIRRGIKGLHATNGFARLTAHLRHG